MGSRAAHPWGPAAEVLHALAHLRMAAQPMAYMGAAERVVQREG